VVGAHAHRQSTSPFAPSVDSHGAELPLPQDFQTGLEMVVAERSARHLTRKKTDFVGRDLLAYRDQARIAKDCPLPGEIEILTSEAGVAKDHLI
jgi:hypothetical protein